MPEILERARLTATKCPHCAYDRLSRGYLTVFPGRGLQQVTCDRCHKTWTDMFEFDRHVLPTDDGAPGEEHHG